MHGVKEGKTTRIIKLTRIVTYSYFDGDRVKIYSDNSIVNAIWHECYDDNPDMIETGLRRTKPIVVIPPEEGIKHCTTNLKEFKKLIVNTFSNQTGKISNIAVSFAVDQYKKSNSTLHTEDDNDDYCARCTAITGLEIDAAKKGKHPLEDIKELDEIRQLHEKGHDTYSTGSYFIKIKDPIRDLKKSPVIYLEQKRDSTYILKTHKNDSHGFTIVKPADDVHNIFQLPFIFAEREYECIHNPNIDEEKAKKILNAANGYPYFNFELYNPGWAIELSVRCDYEEKAKSVGELSKAYLDIRNDVKAYQKALNDAKYSNPLNMLLVLLKEKHDIDPDSGQLSESILQTLTDSINYTKQCIHSYEEAKNAFDLLSTRWISSSRDTRPTILKEILNIPHAMDIDPRISHFLCDFSLHGYYTLYYIIKIIISEYQSILPIEDIIYDKIKSHQNEYYNYLLELFKKYFDRYSDNKDDACKEVWEDILNQECLSLLWNIVGCTDKENPTDEEIENLIKYVWMRRQNISILMQKVKCSNPKKPTEKDYENLKSTFGNHKTHEEYLSAFRNIPSTTIDWKKVDDNGRFFWSVIDIEYIKKCEYKYVEVKNAKRNVRK